MHKRYLLKGFITTLIILGVSGIIYLYTAGYRLEKNKNEIPIDFTVTGMINAKSIPEGATVYLNDEIKTATNSSIGGIAPGIYNLKIVKSGFTPWEKNIEVFPELVTDITAVLVSKTPRIEPLTQTGATNPAISPTLSTIAYFSQDDKNPGVWTLPLNPARLNIFSATPSVVLEDTTYTKFSQGLNIFWSPDEKQLLIQQDENSYYLAELGTRTAKTVTNWLEIKEGWDLALTEKRSALLEKLDISEELKELALHKETIWSPDGKKFLYKIENQNGQNEYRVYNMENPLPVGENVDTLVLTTEKYLGNGQEATAIAPKFSWYADSFHLIVLQREMNETDNRGQVSLIRIDGTNKTEIYNNKIYSDNIFSSPNGDKIILLTSFRTTDQIDLYTVSVR